MTKVAVIGAGPIGRSWSIVFARAGFEVSLWDPAAQAVPAGLHYIAERLPELREAGLLAEPPAVVLPRIRPAASLATRWTAPSTCRRTGPSGSRQAGPVRRARPRRPARRGARQQLQRHPGQRLHRKPARPRALPDRPSGQPALSGPAGGTLPGAVDRPRGGRAHPRADGPAGQVPATVNKEVQGSRSTACRARCWRRRSGWSPTG